MKTREEIVAAIMEISREASLNDFTFCAMLDAEEIATLVQIGRPHVAVGLCANLQHSLLHKIEKRKRKP